MLDHALVEQLTEQANEILNEIEPIAVQWRDQAELPRTEDIDAVFRGLHTIKGGFGFFGLENIKHLSHALEDYLSDVRSMRKNLTPDIARRCCDAFTVLRALCNDTWESDQRDISALLETLGYAGISGLRAVVKVDDLQWPLVPNREQCEQAIQMGRFIYRITMFTHRDVEEQGLTLLDMNDMLSAMGNPLNVAIGINEIGGVDDCLLMDLPYQVLFMSKIAHEDLLPTLDIPAAQIELLPLEQYLGNRVDHPIDGVEYLLRNLAVVSEELARNLGKQVQFEFAIEDIQLNPKQRMALQGSLIHLLRNALDHGIENPQQRAGQGKSEHGQIVLSSAIEGDQLVLCIQDDGAGIDPQRIQQRACERGLIAAGQVFKHDSEVFDLLFAPGFSTCDSVSEISGRGVGMDVVKQQIENLGGQIEIHSTLNKGTTFTLRLPI